MNSRAENAVERVIKICRSISILRVVIAMSMMSAASLMMIIEVATYYHDYGMYACSAGYFKCDSSCVPDSYMCDGHQSCLSGVDEIGCDSQVFVAPVVSVNLTTRDYLRDSQVVVNVTTRDYSRGYHYQRWGVCPEVDLPAGGKMVPNNFTDTTLIDVEKHLLNVNYTYASDGRWIPTKCIPRWKVAIVIPFRHRELQLSIFLKHMIPFLQSQHLEFSIFISEQANEIEFNRAMLMNVGYKEALNFTQWDCFIFHDVDHIPQNYANYYGCSHMPRHFISGEEQWKWKLPYSKLFGGVTGFTRRQMEIVNGFANVYWGWGAEDDDMFNRVEYHGYFKTRQEGPTAFYNTIKKYHVHDKKPKNNKRNCLLKHFKERLLYDGLSNLQYPTPNVTVLPLYVNISTDIQPLEWDATWHAC